ncbi:hypothetical protein GCM10023185_38290 [Hymenobacter saemangeumensis]|uniref:Uncharacterized protein n=1 Tax=Hymenobacter saemangeumensis TaxID=1084522 RepID=A0ABP8IQE9_9BACT
MFRNLPDCIETLEDAGARFYTITGPGINLSYAPEDEGAATPDACLQRFERDYTRLGAGLYTVTHKKNSAANRNPASFRFVKVAEGANVGSTAGADGFALADMQLKMQQMQHDQEIRWLKRDHEDELRRLKSKENQPDGMDKLINAVGQINQLLQNAKTQHPGTVAGLPAAAPAQQPTTPTVPVNEQEAIVNDTVQALHDALGQDDERTLEVLRKIAKVAKENPAQINNLVSFL